MKFRKILLTLDECSEIRIVLSKKIDEVKNKLDTLSNIINPDDFDKDLFSYWQKKLVTLSNIFENLCSTDIYEDKKDEN